MVFRLPFFKEKVKRQFFRLVSDEITVWYAAHSTRNPLGVAPPPHVTIVDGDKFEAERMRIGAASESSSSS
jgi:hypothetical protein